MSWTGDDVAHCERTDEDPKFYALPTPEPEVSDRERRKFLREIRRAKTVREKQLLAFSWATGRVLR